MSRCFPGRPSKLGQMISCLFAYNYTKLSAEKSSHHKSKFELVWVIRRTKIIYSSNESIKAKDLQKVKKKKVKHDKKIKIVFFFYFLEKYESFKTLSNTMLQFTVLMTFYIYASNGRRCVIFLSRRSVVVSNWPA